MGRDQSNHIPAAQKARLIKLARELSLSESLVNEILSPGSALPQGKEPTEKGKVFKKSSENKPISWNRFKSVPQESIKVDGVPGIDALTLAVAHQEVEVAVTHAAALFKQQARFLEVLQPAVTEQLLLLLWGQGQRELVLKICEFEAETCSLGLVKLFHFRQLFERKLFSEAFVFMQRYQRPIELAIMAFGGNTGLQSGAFFCEIATAALTFENYSLARRLLQLVEPNDPSRQKALDLLLKVGECHGDGQLRRLERQLEDVADWRHRLRLFVGWLSEVERGDGLSYQERPALNHLLGNWPKWFDDKPHVWSEFATVLVRHFKLKNILPNILNVFRQQILNFKPQRLDRVLWQAVLDADQSAVGLWGAVAHLHLGIRDKLGQKEIWQAFLRFQQASSHEVDELGVSWGRLRVSAIDYLRRCVEVDEVTRSNNLHLLGIAVPVNQVSLVEIEKYIEADVYTPPMVWDRLGECLGKLEVPELELKVLRRKCQNSSYTNSELNRFFRLAEKTRNNALSWRALTILFHRNALSDGAHHAWKISGEKRDEWFQGKLSFKDLGYLVCDFSEKERQIVHSLVRLAVPLNQLYRLYGSKPSSQNAKVVTGAELNSVSERLNVISWLPKHSEEIILPLNTCSVRPPFVEIIVESVFSKLLLELSRRLGFCHWSFDIVALEKSLQHAFTILKEGHKAIPVRYAKWLRTLNPKQRSCFYGLPPLIKESDPQRVSGLLVIFLVRLAVIINQNHNDVLASLKAMRCSLFVVRGVEAFLLSEEYERLRTEHKAAARMKVPLSISRQISDLKPDVPNQE